jgi:hypothetical protein
MECGICGHEKIEVDWEAMKKVERPQSEWGNND